MCGAPHTLSLSLFLSLGGRTRAKNGTGSRTGALYETHTGRKYERPGETMTKRNHKRALAMITRMTDASTIVNLATFRRRRLLYG